TNSVTDLITKIIIAVNLITLVYGFNKVYTLVNSTVAILCVVYVAYFAKWKQLNLFYLAFTVCLLPFAICNGVLTSWPILIYNDSQNLSIRMGTIPFEDLFYNFSMIILWCFFYEKFRY
ncbi:MAG TPA: lycopene cyclase domain-containing protein, partial [Bacteroidia bacterium]|nr:lycopene cyclase domain-containing protein [Bacteroidia bacterium]